MAWNLQNVYKKRNLVISPKQQSAFGTALIDADLTHRLEFDPGAYVALTRQYRSDRDKTGKGHDFPTYRVATDQDVAFSITLDVDDFLLGWIPAFLMGLVTDAGQASPYTHTIKFQQTTGNALATTIYSEDSDPLKRKFIDVGINVAEFSGSGRGVVQARLDMIGSGKATDGAIANMPALPTIKQLLASDAAFSIGNPGAATAIDPDRVLSWTVTLTQDITPFKGPGSVLYGTRLQIGHPSCKLAMTIAAKETDDLVTRFLGDTETEVQINIATAADCELDFLFPSIYLSAAQPATDTNDVVIQVESNEDSLIKKANTEIVQVTAKNNVPAYLVAGA
ncbi:MAG: hypothetical protein LAN83_03960 [Acidobacteriia bacterium]|nr:hypothetical protein [Terriglobia bacterium]